MSGLSHHPGKVAQGQLCRGFESLSLRQKLKSHSIKSHQNPIKYNVLFGIYNITMRQQES